MAKLIPMAPDSAGSKVLLKLYHLGGKAPISSLMGELRPEFQTALRFDQVATDPLRKRGLVKVVMRNDGDWLMITKEGSLMARQHVASLPEQRKSVASPKPLDVKKFMSWGQTRPGALDYRAIPSRMGNERIPFVRGKEETPA
jgi:hypothetical protein